MTHASLEFAPRPELEYPFARDWAPEPGKPFEVAEGVYWLRVPLPIELDHINLWLLRDNDGWVIVDSGYDAPECRAVWETVFAEFLSPDSVNRIVVTHFHPDHIGLASWLALQCDCQVQISRGEFNLYHSIFNRDDAQFDQQANVFLTQAGFNDQEVAAYTAFFAAEDKPAEARVQKSMCDFIADTDELLINGRTWRVVVGNGHSPEHACLYCEELGVLISGDQALPRISSNVSVYVSTSSENPLDDWLVSCAKLQQEVPDKTLVLPSHQEPFYGLHVRMDQLVYDHHAQLNRLRGVLHEPSKAVDLVPVLFKRELKGASIIFATGETLAHINYLIGLAEVSKTIDANGVALYQAV